MDVKVVNIRFHSCDVYIGRKSGSDKKHHWGNPFVIGRDGNRQEVIKKFELWFLGAMYHNIEPERRSWMQKNIQM